MVENTALLSEVALQRIHQSGVGEFWSTDSVPHPGPAVGLVSVLAQAITRDVSVG